MNGVKLEDLTFRLKEEKDKRFHHFSSPKWQKSWPEQLGNRKKQKEATPEKNQIVTGDTQYSIKLSKLSEKNE